MTTSVPANARVRNSLVFLTP